MTSRILLLLAALLATSVAAAADDLAEREALAAKLPGVSADDLRASPVPGLYEVTVGAQIVYVSADGRYLLNGSMIDLERKRNLTEERLATARAEWVQGLDEARMVIFEPEGRTRHTITVFTDIDCGYCRAMHREIDELLDAGVRVRYILYPRNGPDTPSAEKAEHVWCSPDRRDALTRAKAGETVRAPACENPVTANFALGRTVPVTGTPTLVTDGGDVSPGYLEPDALVAELDRLKSPRISD